MKAHILDSEALLAIPPQSLIAYAQTEGWESGEKYGAHSTVFHNPKTNGEIIIPATTQLGDYGNVVSELITLFAKYEDRSELQVYRDLSTADKDIVRVRSSDADEKGTLSLPSGVELVNSSKNMLHSAACSAWKRRASFKAGSIRLAEDYMARVRLGQTEQGSYVVTLLAPVPPMLRGQIVMFPDDEAIPYERNVTQLLSSGLDAAAIAIEKQNLGGTFAEFENAVGLGLSANLCEATARLAQREQGIEVSISWARTRPNLARRWSRRFSQSDGEILHEVARQFYDRQPRPDERIAGFVVVLNSTDSALGGSVNIHTSLDGHITSIKAHLTGPDYNLAIRAHRSNQPISLIGTLVREGRRWKIEDARDVSTISDAELSVYDEPTD